MLAALTASSVSAASVTPAVQTPPAAQDWNAVSRSTTRAYFVDVNSIKVAGPVSRVTLARVPLSPPTPADHSYTLVELEFRCAARQSRPVAEVDHDETGAALDRFETGEDFSSFRTESLDAYVAEFVCEGSRAAPPTFTSIPAFIDAGRPGPRD